MVIDKLRERLDKYPQLESNAKLAAVLVPIIKNNEYKLILEKRVEKLGRHSGEVSFPGGIIEEGETPLETALRETEEEIGIPRENIEVLGYLKPTKVRSTGFIIIPVVGHVKNIIGFKINKAEVERVLILKINEIRKGKRKIIIGNYYKVGDTVIWGATARILDQFFKKIS